jgi:hypothetical protein
LLGSYHLPLPKGGYWTPSPVFVHAGPCEQFDENEPPEILSGMPLSIRAYDANHQMIYPLTDVGNEKGAIDLVERALADVNTSYVNVHTAQFGCFLCRAERA